MQRDTVFRIRPVDMTFRKPSSSADERRTWASWVNRRTNRGQRTRRDSLTGSPFWKTLPNSRASGATNDQDHRVAKVDSPLQNAHPSPLRCIVLFVDRSPKRFVFHPGQRCPSSYASVLGRAISHAVFNHRVHRENRECSHNTLRETSGVDSRQR